MPLGVTLLGPKFARPRRIIGCVLVLYHLAAVTISNLSESTAFSQTLHSAVNPYLRFSGQWQEWDMFTTIPLYLSISARIVARDMNGKETSFDPLLPGLSAAPDELRLVAMFARMVWARKFFRWHAERYQGAACDALAARTGEMPRSLHFELDAEVIRQLSAIRKDGKIADKRVFKSEEVLCQR